MCEFKYCEGPHACFLRDISPCPGTCRAADGALGESEDEARLRMTIRGFLDREGLENAMGMFDTPDEANLQEAPGNGRDEGRVTSKLRRAVEVLGLVRAS